MSLPRTFPADPLRLSFPRTVRLTRSPQFRQVRAQGRSHVGRYMVLGVLGEQAANQVGIITSRRVGNAVTRNRVRRRLRDLLRQSRPDWRPGRWFVLVARASAAGASYEALRSEWLKLARRGRILIEPPGAQPPPEGAPAVPSPPAPQG